MMRVAIRGSGMAATGCAQLLQRAGIQATRTSAPRPAVPAVMLSDAALALLRDVFDRPLLFTDRTRIVRRVVSWGQGPARVMPHGATLIREADIWGAFDGVANAGPVEADFTIDTSGARGTTRLFGDRHAVAVAVRLCVPQSREECRIEAVPSGWLFLVPGEGDQGTLLAIGAGLDQLLDESRSVAPLVQVLGAPSQPFPAAPRLADQLVGPDWLACGSAAIGFDPICGDGAAQSVREAILAAAVVAAIAEGAEAEPLLIHFRSMLIAAMRRHLILCLQFYRGGGAGDWWEAQCDALAQGHAWCTRQLAALPEPRFELHGFRLVPRRAAA